MARTASCSRQHDERRATAPGPPRTRSPSAAWSPRPRPRTAARGLAPASIAGCTVGAHNVLGTPRGGQRLRPHLDGARPWLLAPAGDAGHPVVILLAARTPECPAHTRAHAVHTPDRSSRPVRRARPVCVLFGEPCRATRMPRARGLLVRCVGALARCPPPQIRSVGVLDQARGRLTRASRSNPTRNVWRNECLHLPVRR